MSNLFHYNGRDLNGKAVTGNIEAKSTEDVVAQLKKDKIIPLNITPIKPKKFIGPKLLSLLPWQKVEPYHLMNFCRQLAVLNDAGLSLIKAINKLAALSNSRPLSIVLTQVANDVAAGLSLSEALRKHPAIFSPLITNIIDIGENTGHLGEALHYVSTYIETTINNRRRLLNAIHYPLLVVVTIVIAILIINLLVIPKFTVMFTKFGLHLPLATRIIMAVSEFMVKNINILLIILAVIALGLNRVLTIPGIRYVWDKYKLALPIFGNLQRRIIISQFTWTFSLILRSGVPIIKGLALTSAAINNAYFSTQLLKMKTSIEHGENLSQSAIASGLFTPITIQMIEVGEESEKLDEALAEVTKYYDAEIDYDLKRLNELIEPLLLIMIGGIVLLLAIGIYFPMWDLIKIAKI